MLTREKIKDIAGELDLLSGENEAYFNRKTHEIYVRFMSESFDLEDDDIDESSLADWQVEDYHKWKEICNGDDWLMLPDSFEIDDWSLMQQFAYSIPDEKLQNQFLSAINGRGAFRMFKDLVHRHGIQDHWYDFKAAGLEQTVIRWLEENNIPYEGQQSEEEA